MATTLSEKAVGAAPELDPSGVVALPFSGAAA